jgi:hypothetical protein
VVWCTWHVALAGRDFGELPDRWVSCRLGAANPPTWALGWFVSSYVISANIDERFTNFGASGAIVFGLLTWLLLATLVHETEPEAAR